MSEGRPRVALLHFTCPPVIGGVEGLLRTHARLAVQHGYAVSVLAGRGRQFDRRVPVQLFPWLDSKHPEIVRVAEELRAGTVSARFAAVRERLVAWWRAEVAPRYDTVVVHNAFTLHFNLPLTAALHAVAAAGRPRLVAWCHDLAWTNPLYLPLLHEAYPWQLLKTCHPAVRYVAVSHDRQRDLAAVAGVPTEQIAVVPAGVDLARWARFGAATQRLLAALHLAPEELVLLLPARITRRKNIELAIRIVAALRQRGARPRLLVTGPPGPHDVRAGAYLDELLQLCRELGVEREVAFLYPHRLRDATVADLYQVADALLFPSRQEGFGIPLLEAGLSRLPVFCTDLAPLREIAGASAHYFSPDTDPATVAEGLLESLRHDRAARLRRRVLRDYAWPAIFARQIAPLLAGAMPDTAPCAPGPSIPEPRQPAQSQEQWET
ncbi:MAG TPA: glycosyltransferase [Chloroflexota bacterium]|nr:glycosyltransferase [Chloroflexota bacterium]